MTSIILDASVAAAALFQEEYSPAARNILKSNDELLAPEFLHVEIANVIWKRYRRNEIEESDVLKFFVDVQSLPITLLATNVLLSPAIRLAIKSGRTVYDCLYLALAIRKKGILISADRRFVNGVTDRDLRKYVRFIV